MKNNYFTVIDIGSSKLAVAVCNIDNNNVIIDVLSIGSIKGVEKGVVKNAEKLSKSIGRVVSDANRLSAKNIKSVYVIVSGIIVESTLAKDYKITSDDAKGVVLEDIQKILETANKRSIPADHKVFDFALPKLKARVLPGSEIFVKSLQKEIESEVLLFHTQKMHLEQIFSIVRNAGYELEEFIAGPLATAQAVIEEKDKISGVIVLDIGASSTEVIAYSKGRPIFSGVIPIAGNNISNDMKYLFNYSPDVAENIVVTYGKAISEDIDENEKINIDIGNGDGPTTLDYKYFVSIIEARLEEIFNLVKKLINSKGIEINSERFPAGIILTGGCSLISDIDKLAGRIYKLPINLPVIESEHISSNFYKPATLSTLMGATKLVGMRNGYKNSSEPERNKSPRLWETLKDWILGII